MAIIINNCFFFNEPPSRGPGDDDDTDDDTVDPSGPGRGTDDDGGSIDTPDDPDDPDNPDECNGDPCTGGGGGGGGGPPRPPELVWVCRNVLIPQTVYLSNNGIPTGLFTIIFFNFVDCVQIPRNEINPATDSGPFSSKDECENNCAIWVCRKYLFTWSTAGVDGTGYLSKCVKVKRRDKQPGDIEFNTEAECNQNCSRIVEFPEGEPSGYGPGPWTPSPGGGGGGGGPSTGGGGGGGGPSTGGGGGGGTSTSGYNCEEIPSTGGVQNRRCVPVSANATYTTLSSCQQQCISTSGTGFGWACIDIPTTGGTTRKECRYVFAGSFSTSSLCAQTCQKYSCSEVPTQVPIPGGGTGGMTVIIRRCVPNPNGQYATLSDCEFSCPSGIVDEPDDTGNGLGTGSIFQNLTTTESDSNSGESFTDPTYFVNSINNIFEPTTTRGENSQIFSEVQDSGVNLLLGIGQTSFSNLNRSINRLTNQFVRASVKNNISDILYNLKTPDGRKYPDLKIHNAIKGRILDSTTSRMDYGYILNLAVRTILQPAANSTLQFGRFIAAQYGNSAAQIANTRQETIAKLQLLHRQTSVDSSAFPIVDQNIAISTATARARPLDYRKKRGLKKEFLKLWYILPEDIYAKLSIEEQTQNFYNVKIPNSEVLTIQTNLGSSVNINVLEYNYGVEVQTPNNMEVALPNTQLHRAHTLKNEDHQKVMYNVNSRYSSELRVISPSANNLEFNYTLSTALPSHIVLKIDKTSIEDIPYFQNPFVRKTKARYTLMTDPAEIEDAIKFRIYPWKVYPINYNDPILGHISSQSTIEMTYNNFSFEQFGDDLGGLIFVRRVPKVIVLIPTDRYDYVFFNGKSKLVDWNERVLKFGLSQDKNYFNPGMRTNWVKINYSYPLTDIDNNINNTGLRAEYVSSAPIFTNTYVEGDQPNRTEDAFRALYRVINTLNSTYNIINGLTWKDVYSRLTPEQYTTIQRGVPPYMLNKLRIGEKTGVKIYHTQGFANSIKSRLGELKQGQQDNLPIYIEDINE